jgi:hypothetical protein
MVQAKTHVDLLKPSLSMSVVKNQYMDFALEQLRSSGSYETQNAAWGLSFLRKQLLVCQILKHSKHSDQPHGEELSWWSS